MVKHGQEVVVFRLFVVVGRVDAVIQGQKIPRFAAAVHQIDPPNAGDHVVRVARILTLGQVDKAAVAFVLDAVVDEQKCLGRIAQQGVNQFAQLFDQQRSRAQKSVHLVMAYVGQMGCQMRAGVVRGRTQQVLDVSGLGQHERRFCLKYPKVRKSYYSCHTSA